MSVKINIQQHLTPEYLMNETELTLKLFPLFQKNNTIVLTSTGEGYSFKINGLYDYLDKLCNHFNYDKKKIFIETWNLLERHDEYNIIIKNEIYDCHYFIKPDLISFPTEYKLAAFLSRPDYLRLTFHDMLQNVLWKDELIYTFHNDFIRDPWPSGIKQFIIKGGSYKKIEKTTPYSDLSKEPPTLPLTPPKNIFGLKEIYNKVALEICLETVYHEGFFVTEKTLRPIFFGRPFIAIGPQNFEKNLEKLGFICNFNFPFYYDVAHSIEKLRMIFDVIHSWYLRSDIESWFESIVPILVHNQNVLKQYADNKGFIDWDIIRQLN